MLYLCWCRQILHELNIRLFVSTYVIHLWNFISYISSATEGGVRTRRPERKGSTQFSVFPDERLVKDSWRLIRCGTRWTQSFPVFVQLPTQSPYTVSSAFKYAIIVAHIWVIPVKRLYLLLLCKTQAKSSHFKRIPCDLEIWVRRKSSATQIWLMMKLVTQIHSESFERDFISC